MNGDFISIETNDDKYVIGEDGVKDIVFWSFDGMGVSDVVCYFKVIYSNGQEVLIRNTVPHVLTTKPSE